nr:MAG TPA: hypothetical protein [Caudoviricetes sp.]
MPTTHPLEFHSIYKGEGKQGLLESNQFLSPF